MTPQKTIAERSWQFPNRMPALAGVAKEVFDWMADLPLSSRAKYSTGLAVEEMASNIIKYGYDDEGEHVIRLRITANLDLLEIAFEDDGHPFDPTQHPSPDIENLVASRKAGGLGIELVRRMSETMTYERAGRLNRLTVLIRRLQPDDTQFIALSKE